MAEKRMLSKVISISKKFNIRVDSHFTRLLYVLLIPHSDDFGRLTGCPHKVKALVIPMLSDGWEMVEQSLGKLQESELITWYEVGDEQYIQINNFDDHQQGLHKRTRSKFPDPPELSRKFPEFPSEQNRTEGNRTEEKGTEQNGVSPEDLVLKWLNQYKVTYRGQYQIEQVSSFIGMVDIEVMELCIKQSENKSSGYAISIIERHIREGKTTKDSIRHLQPVPDKKKEDPELESRHREIARNKWIAEGKDPDEFEFGHASNH